MAYDERLVERIRALGDDDPPLTEKKMFGGMGFMLNGNMAVAASGAGGLMVRIEPDQAEELVRRPGAERMEMKGRTMNGWLHIDADALETNEVLSSWLSIGLDFAGSLPPK